MSRFLGSEKQRQIEFRKHSPYFTDAARANGVYRGKPRSFCLPLSHAEENLLPEIREASQAYFATFDIRWHDGQAGKPSNHLCSSQVCCVNFLFLFSRQPDALAEVLRPVFPDLHRMLPIENGQYVAFEWIGQENYLNERIAGNGKRTRGAHFTSADAAVMFERADGKQQIVLIEWKYTEAYGGASLKMAKSGTDRTEIYRPLFECNDCPIDKSLVPSFDALFVEPFYQFMRQQYLANEMEKAHELGADVVSVLHIAPAVNTDFDRITSQELAGLGETATGVWNNLVKTQGRFITISTERLFGTLSIDRLPQMRAWLEYIGARYSWIQESQTP